MKVDSLWYDVTMPRQAEPVATVTLTHCRNCGQVKVLSNPCGLDHLAAILEFNAARAELAALSPATRPEATDG